MGKIANFFTLERTFAGIVLAIVSWQLFAPPRLGLADNGDFARSMVFFDLTHAPKDWSDRYFGHFNRHYTFDRVDALRSASPDSVSSELVFIAPATVVSWLSNSVHFDLLLLGGLHAAVFAAAVYLLLATSKRFAGDVRTAAIILGSIVFTDIAYTAYFNSFYSESATFLFLLLTVGCFYGAAGSTRRATLWTIGYGLASLGTILAKYQNLVLLPVFLGFGWLLVKRLGGVRRVQAFLVVSFVLCYASYRFCISLPPLIEDAVLYNSVFNGVLADSPSPRDDLASLGLDPGMAKYARTSAFQPDSPRYDGAFMQTLRARVTIRDIAVFYLRRPVRLISALDRTVRLSIDPRPALGNYEKASGYPRGARSVSWAMWSSVRTALVPKSLASVLTIFLLYLALLARRWRKATDSTSLLNLEWSAMMVLVALLQLGLITISDGVGDVTKHAFLFNLLLDYTLVSLGSILIGALARVGTAGRASRQKVAHA